MAAESYILCLEQSSQGDVELLLSVLNIAGRGFSFYGSNNDSGSISLWAILKGKNNPAEIIKQLEATPPVKKVTIVEISTPMKETEIADLRVLFLKVGWDSREVSNEELSAFIHSSLHRQATHYIDFDHKRMRNPPVKIKIKPLQDHPQFSPDWLKEKNISSQDLPDKEFTRDDIKSEIIEFTTTVDIDYPGKRKWDQ